MISGICHKFMVVEEGKTREKSSKRNREPNDLASQTLDAIVLVIVAHLFSIWENNIQKGIIGGVKLLIVGQLIIFDPTFMLICNEFIIRGTLFHLSRRTKLWTKTVFQLLSLYLWLNLYHFLNQSSAAGSW